MVCQELRLDKYWIDRNLAGEVLVLLIEVQCLLDLEHGLVDVVVQLRFQRLVKVHGGKGPGKLSNKVEALDVHQLNALFYELYPLSKGVHVAQDLVQKLVVEQKEV
jgi:hypothetical protein